MPDPHHLIPLAGVPSGLIALPVLRPDGTAPLDRRGRIKTDKVVLAAAPGQPTHQPGDRIPGLEDKDVRWAVATSARQGRSVQQKYQAAAADVGHRLALAGVITITATVTDDFTLGEHRTWTPTAAWRAWHDSLTQQTVDASTNLLQRAHGAAEQIAQDDPGLADALRTAKGRDVLLSVLIHAAEDLADGVVHDGPRAFSQAHFEHTKEREDVTQILRNAGASDDTILSLGLRRSPYLGMGGPITVGEGVHLRVFNGPVQFRADDPGLRPHLARPAALALIENLQAAEAACDQYPDLAVLWFAGQPSLATLAHIASLARQSSRVLLAPDADLGGVRIAQRVLTVLPDPAAVNIVDAGEQPHRQRRPFSPATIGVLRTLASGSGPSAAFAATVAGRGYPVEQEAAIRAALTATLR